MEQKICVQAGLLHRANGIVLEADFFIFWYSLFSPMYRQTPKEQSTKQIYRHAFHTKLMFAVYKKYLLKVWESDIMKCPASSVFNLGFFCSET